MISALQTVHPVELDRATCRRARLARDARFDGRFFIAVKTTGIFCRPICPALPPSERNVLYFPSAAAAAEAGFRACLRCRPECAPGTPAWAGPSTTVARALRLIADGALETADVEALAERLGIGARHLRRLFVEHLGASPIAVAQTRRLLSAKRLIDETDMPLTTIAMAAGYGSIRRFNAVFLETYGRSPRELRRHRFESRRSHDALSRYSFQLRYRPPFDWAALLSFLAPRAIPGIEEVAGNAYRRSIEIAGEHGWLEVTPGGKDALRLDIEFPEPAQMLHIVSRARRLLDLDADPMAIESHLAADCLLAPMLRRHPGLRVPGAWDGFEISVRAMLGQQVSVRAATTLAGRLVGRFGRPLKAPDAGTRHVQPVRPGSVRLTHLFPLPEHLADADIAAIGVPAARAEAIRRFASAVANGAVRFDGATETDAFCQSLTELPGIGPWTAQYIALRALGDPDAFPSADLGLLRATGVKTAAELARRAELWRPWRAYAALLLWTNH
jgi:AraC family transcriptional regulator of adaptative response / DNA-3-methyladenine glycosylase II